MHKKTVRISLFALLLVATFRVEAATSLAAETRILSNSTLPGIPAAFEVTISNQSGEPITLLNSVAIAYSRNDGETRATKWLQTGTVTTLPDPTVAGVLNPGEKRKLYFANTPFVATNFAYNDGEMLLPGRYTIDVTVGGAASSRASYIVRDVTGVDAEVWSYMRSLVKERRFTSEDWMVHGSEIMAFISDGRASSAYAAYARLLTMSSDAVDDSVITQLDPSVRSEAKLRIASLHLKRAERFAGALEFWKAARESDAARGLLETVADAQYLTEAAKSMLKECLTQRQYEDSYQWRLKFAEPTPKPVEPFVDCVERADASFTAHFGYRNQNGTSKGILAGARNQITPPPLDAGQRKLFQAGEHHDVFVVTTNAEEVMWHLDGSIAAARRSSPLCQ